MATIYNIYEHMYNSILGNSEEVLARAESDAMKALSTRKELLLKILAKSGKLNKNERLILRDIFKVVFNNGQYKYVQCQLPDKIRESLIVASNKKLDKTDFTKFPNNQKEYDFQCNMEFLGIENQTPDIKELIKQAEKKSGVNVKGKGHSIIRLGDAIIIYTKRLLYFYTVEGQLIRVIIRACEYGSNTNIRLLEQKEEL